MKNVYLNELHPFKNHPFKVENDLELYELIRSIEDKDCFGMMLATTWSTWQKWVN